MYGPNRLSANPCQVEPLESRTFLSVTMPAGIDAAQFAGPAIHAAVGQPVVQIFSPSAGSQYFGGSVIHYVGQITNAGGTPFPSSSYVWRLVLQAGDNKPAQTVRRIIGGTRGTLVVPHLKVADLNRPLSLMLSIRATRAPAASTSVGLTPFSANLTVNATFPGFVAGVNGKLVNLPATLPFVAGMYTRVTAPAVQSSNGLTFVFDHWSDGGARSHLARIGLGGTFLTAVYKFARTGTFATTTAIG